MLNVKRNSNEKNGMKDEMINLIVMWEYMPK